MRINGQFVLAPTLAELFALHAEDVGDKLSVSMTGTIQSFNPTTRTASVILGETFVRNDGTFVQVTGPLTDVPVITLQGGTGGISGGVHLGLPISPGDECLLVFCDFNIGNWFEEGGSPVPPDQRQHDVSDAFAFVGPNSLANPLLSFLAAFEGGLSSETAKLAINPETGMITIANEVATLAQILTNLIAAVNATNTPPGGGSLIALLVAAVSTLATAVATLNTSIALESSVIPVAAAAALGQEPTLVTLAANLATLAASAATQSTNASADAAAALAFTEALFY